MHVTDWAAAQKEDPELDAVLQWLGSKKKADLMTIARTSLPSEVPSICAPPPKGRMRICYYS